MEPDNVLLSETEAAEMLGLTTRVLAAWRETDKGPLFVGNGSDFVYPRRDLLFWAQQRGRERRICRAQIETAEAADDLDAVQYNLAATSPEVDVHHDVIEKADRAARGELWAAVADLPLTILLNPSFVRPLKAAMVWPFHDAPLALQALSEGGDEDWLVLWPPGSKGAAPDAYISWHDRLAGGDPPDRYDLPCGAVVFIGAHA